MSDIKRYTQVVSRPCNPNDENEVNKIFQGLKTAPDVAIFDTFVAEEMFRCLYISPN